MKKSLILISGISLSTWILFSFFSVNGKFDVYHVDDIEGLNFSGNPPTGRTGAPGESNCTSCHSGTTQSAAGVIDYNFSGVDYVPSTTYDFSISIASGAKNGFQMTILDDSDDAAGSFIAGSNTTAVNSSGRNYIRHSSSSGITDWDFQWTAPEEDKGNLTVYYSFAAANANGSTSGDIIYLGQETIPVNASLGFNKYEKIENKFKVFHNSIENNLKIEYYLESDANIVFQLIDLNGKLISEMNLGHQITGNYKQNLDLYSDELQGLYFVSMLQDNMVYNQKVFIP